jgi:metabolite-proton symporter
MTAEAANGSKPINMTRVVMTALAASSIEWYDFFIYGTAAALVFPKLFFASDLPPYVAQIASFSTFAVGFIARPIGGVVFGHFGDKYGRKKALVTAMLIMGLATTAVGLLPSYKAIGVVAPLILVALRFLQGLAVGGQWGGAALLAIENAPAHKRGFYGSFAQMGVPAGVISANLIFLIMGMLVDPEAFQAWAWRIPFLLSIVLVGLSMYVQFVLEDTAEFRALEKAEDKVERKRSPIIQAIVKNPKGILLAAGSFVAANGTFYIMITFAVSYWTNTLHLPKNTILWAVLLGSIISAPVLPITAALSDRFGRRGIFLAGAALELLWAVPFFLLIDTGQFPAAVLALAGGLVFNSVMYGLQAAMMTEMFDIEFRYSGASLGYQMGAILGGGFAPTIAVALLNHYNSSLSISAYMAVLCAVSFISVLVLTETHKREHRTPAKAKAV